MTQNYNSGKSIRIGDTVPDFTTLSTFGTFNFHRYIRDSWCLFFSHPADFTPVCTTELGTLAVDMAEWTQRGVRLVGLSIGSPKEHLEWLKDLRALYPLPSPLPSESSVDASLANWPYPIIADESGDVASLFGMLDSPNPDLSNMIRVSMTKFIPVTVRAVFLIDPAQRVRATWSYPASCGRNWKEVLRVVDSIQLSDQKKIATPVNWVQGEEVIVRYDVSDEEAKTLFPGGFRTVTPYLRYTACPTLDSTLPPSALPPVKKASP